LPAAISLRVDSPPRGCVVAASSKIANTPRPIANTTFPIPLLRFDPLHAVLPDPKITPSDTFPGVTAGDVCTPGWATEHRHVTEGMRDKVYAEYGRTEGPGCCEVDHLARSNSVARTT
jgi:hypothetical protein